MPVLPSYRNQSIDFSFYMRATLALNGLNASLLPIEHVIFLLGKPIHENSKGK